MKNNLKSIEFCFETGDGVTLDADIFYEFDIKNDEISFKIPLENNIEYNDKWTGKNVLFDKLLKNNVTQIFTCDVDNIKTRYVADCEDLYGRILDYMNTYVDECGLTCNIKVF